ncbi:MAG: hypothetical protein B6I28_00305 [Fusobacteriia bacterium 4572_132]|nr:MAG: hypothetical protein B6I28_00305 [Fusobacteriia bacterium 4572_132]
MNGIQKGDELQIVVFELEDTYYGVHILQVQEIIKMQEVTKLPNMPVFIEGIINLRDKIIPIMDLRKRFNLKKKNYNGNGKILILKMEKVQFGILVDDISEVEKIPVSIIEEAPKIATGVSEEFISGIAKTQKKLLTILDINGILSKSEKEQIVKI